MKYGMPKDRLYVTYFGGAEGLESDEDTRQFWLDMGYCMKTLKHVMADHVAKMYYKIGNDMTLQLSEIHRDSHLYCSVQGCLMYIICLLWPQELFIIFSKYMLFYSFENLPGLLVNLDIIIINDHSVRSSLSLTGAVV